MKLHHTLETAPPEPTERTLQVAAMFGLGVDRTRTLTVVPETDVPLDPGAVVFITGPSGGGKSTLLRLIAQGLAGREGVTVLRLEELPPAPELPLVDAVTANASPEAAEVNPRLADTLRILSLAGLNDAFVMLRTPGQLSDGQRHRFRFARAMALAERIGVGEGGRGKVVVLADEFGATLDRTCAKAVAAHARKWVSRSKASGGVTLVVATTHDDLLEPLDPDVLVYKGLGERVEVLLKTGNQTIAEGAKTRRRGGVNE